MHLVGCLLSAFFNTSIVGDSSNYRYYISDDGTTSSQLLVYKGKGLNEETFTSADDLMVGDVVTIYGSLITYQNAPEVASGNYLVSHSRTVNTEPSIALAPATLTPTADETDGTVSISFDNLTISGTDDFEIQFYDANDDEIAKPAWIEVEITTEDDNYFVYYVIGANEGEARSAYFKVGAFEIVYSNLVTINQAAPVVDYASLPFTFNDGKSAISDTNGLTSSALGSDFSDSTAPLKFDGQDDWLILKINDAIPETYTLSFDIRGSANGWTGTFKIQISTDGENYSDLKTYTSLSGTPQTEQFDNLDASIRFIRWYFTEKVTGKNVGVGHISLDRPTQTDYNLTLSENGGRYWATFYNSAACYKLPEGAQAFTYNKTTGELSRVGSDGSVIPYNTAVIIIADSANITLTKIDDTAADIHGTNALRGSNYAIPAPASAKAYVLSIQESVLGFFEYNFEGASGNTLPANKAYYIVNE